MKTENGEEIMVFPTPEEPERNFIRTNIEEEMENGSISSETRGSQDNH